MILDNLINNIQKKNNYDDNKKNSSITQSQIQGENYLKFNNIKINEINPQFKLLENFTMIKDNAVEKKNKNEIEQLLELEKEYNRKLSEYSKQQDILMNDTNSYFNKKNNNENKILGKNIRFNNGEIGYVTDEGLYKKYDSLEIYKNTIGKNKCPSKFEQLNIDRNGDRIATNPPLKLGTSMKKGQSCGNAGKNVYVIGEDEPGDAKHVGCYQIASDNGLVYQNDMGNNADVMSCKYRAFDTGSSVFAVSGGGKGTSNCYIGNDLDAVKSGGESINSKETWSATGNWPNATKGGLNNAGQLIIANDDISEVYYTSNQPQEGCDTKYGGGINLSNTVATWGANCLNDNNTTSNTTSNATTSIPASKWLGKLIRIKGGEIGYVTNEGIYRPYNSKDIRKFNMGKNGCPNEIFIDLKSTTRTDKILNSTPPLKVGPLMVKGESCANLVENTNNNWDVKQGNWTNYIKSLDIEGKPTGDFVLGNSSAPSPFNIDPAKKCMKDFRANYQCGNGIAKNIFIDPEASGKGVVFNCKKEYNDCRGYTLVIQDDGNLVIYKNGGEAIWSSKTTGIIGINNLDKNASNGKNGRNYLKSGEYLNDDEFIGSPQGNCYLQMTKGIGLQIMISIPGCSNIGDETYGLINTNENKGLRFTVYDGYFDDNVNYFSKAKIVGRGYTEFFSDLNVSTNNLRNNNTKNYSIEWNGFFVPNLTGNWQFKTKSDDASFVWIGGDNSKYTTTNALVKNPGIHAARFSNEATMNLESNVYYPIKIQFGNNNGTGMFQFFIKSPNGSYTTDGSGLLFNSLPPTNSLAVYTIPIGLNNNNNNIGKVGYVTPDNKLKEYPSNLITKGNQYIELGNFSNPGNDIKTINVKTSDECMTGCNETDGCVGFVYNSNGKCQLKNSNMYPKSARIKSSSGDVLYKRSVNLKNNSSCSKTVVPISGSLWNNYVKDGNMNENVECNLGNYTKEQRKNVDMAYNDLQKTINEMHKRIINLDESDKKLLDSYGINKKKIEKDIVRYNLAYTENNNISKQINNLQGMEQNSEIELINSNYKNLVWTIVAIMMVIGSIKLLK